MNDTPDLLAKAVGPRIAIRQYLEKVAEEYRQAGLVPWRGRWIASDLRRAKIDGAEKSSLIILVELGLLFAALTGGAAFLLLLMYYLAY